MPTKIITTYFKCFYYWDGVPDSHKTIEEVQGESTTKLVTDYKSPCPMCLQLNTYDMVHPEDPAGA